ncbi:uncharacterized protein [Epargyreus clarus]|uniref:uncharacterized protein n=1 Tax=Epargyreus clarus TaxID=520877 RepID=UPI003C2EEA62
MSPPAVRVNTFVPTKESKLDLVSKIIIVFELICGINRLPVFGRLKPVCLALSLAYSLSINIFIAYSTYNNLSRGLGEFVRALKLWQYCMCAILGFAFRKRLREFYSGLIKFDKETDFRMENKEVIKSTVQICLTVGFMIGFITFLYLAHVFKNDYIELIIILLVSIIELHFFGHLLNLLVPRLRFMNHLMKQSLCNRSGIHIVQNGLICPNKTKKSTMDMKKLMDFYHRIIITFDILYEAIKWQMIIILITSFIASLFVSYNLILRYIRSDYTLGQLLVETTMTFAEIVPLFAPCRVVDILHGEVRCLIELLSSRLYENKIEKSSRAVAQAFLALMEARDLSFSLLRIFDIDVSFPFKFLGLLVTYLIILLQFEKVINLDRSTV